MERRIEILKDVLGHYGRSNDEYLFKCPQCNHHKRKFSINLEKNVFKCWVCDYAGHSVRRLVKACGTFTQLAEWDRLEGKADISLFEQLFAAVEPEPEPEVHLPEEFVSLTSKKLPLSSKPALEYLNQRGITKEDVVRWKIGCCTRGPYGERIVIP